MDKKDLKVLLVDDSAFMRNVLKNILENERFEEKGGQGLRARRTDPLESV